MQGILETLEQMSMFFIIAYNTAVLMYHVTFFFLCHFIYPPEYGQKEYCSFELLFTPGLTRWPTFLFPNIVGNLPNCVRLPGIQTAGSRIRSGGVSCIRDEAPACNLRERSKGRRCFFVLPIILPSEIKPNQDTTMDWLTLQHPAATVRIFSVA